MGQFGVGQPVRRKEDARLLTGQGRFIDDVTMPDEACAFVVRSPHAHAKINGIDTSAALQAPGVLAVLTGADLAADGIGGVPCLAAIQNIDGSDMFAPPRPLLTQDRVRCVGDYVALVVAESRDQAKDAAEQLNVDYESLPAVTGTAEAAGDGAPQIWSDATGNTAFRWGMGDKGGVDAAFAKAERISTVDLINQRIVVNSIEPRGAVGQYDASADQYTLHTGSQNVHLALGVLAGILNISPESLRVVSPDVGGGFGMKVFIYPEQGLVLWAAKRVGRPVKWASERTEAFVSDIQGRDHVTHAEIAMDANGKFQAIKVSSTSNMGAYLSNFAPMIATIAGSHLLTGLYDFAAAYIEVHGVFSNTIWVDAYRGAGRPEASYIIERLVDTAARDLGIDPAELRRRNLVPAAKMPYTSAFGTTYDSGDFAANLEDALKLADLDGFARRRFESESRGKLRGIGLNCYVEAAAAMDESAEVVFEDDETVTILIGTLTNGQGHATTYSQVLEDALGIPFESINLVQGDTARIATGNGTGGSRSMMVGGAALTNAADKIIEKGTKIAAHMLEAAEADIEFADGTFSIVGTDRKLNIAEVAVAAEDAANLPDGVEPGLDTKADANVAAGTFPNGCHICEVEVDPDTGAVQIVSYTVVDDFGRVVNPLLLAGQVHGGIVQGAGQALMEGCRYDPDSGQLVTGSYMDYCMPRADNFPSFSLDVNEVLCTTNPMGIKGAGEAGTVGALGATINALVDALRGFGIRHIEMPATSEKVWRAIQDAKAV
jgi:carbon-monoxide dehydrogenase large subunit